MAHDYDAATHRYPSTQMGVAEWKAFFDTPAGIDAIGRIFYDIFNELRSIEDRDAGIRRQGRRPRREAVPLQDVTRYVLPPPASLDPLPAALGELVARAGSHGRFALRVPMNRTHLSNLLAGRDRASRTMLERLAGAADIPPWYFVEWRAMFLSEALHDALIADPALGLRILRQSGADKRYRTWRTAHREPQ